MSVSLLNVAPAIQSSTGATLTKSIQTWRQVVSASGYTLLPQNLLGYANLAMASGGTLGYVYTPERRNGTVLLPALTQGSLSPNTQIFISTGGSTQPDNVYFTYNLTPRITPVNSVIFVVYVNGIGYTITLPTLVYDSSQGLYDCNVDISQLDINSQNGLYTLVNFVSSNYNQANSPNYQYSPTVQFAFKG